MLPVAPRAPLDSPLWEGTTQAGEALLFVRNNEGNGEARLLFEPKRILRLWRPSTGETYTEGVDFVVDEKRRAIKRTASSSIPVLEEAEKYPPFDASKYHHRDGARGLIWGEGHLFHDMQVEVSYTHRRGAWKRAGGATPQGKTALLPNTTAKLTGGEPVRIVLLGDSISAGGNASGAVGAPPHMPPFGTLVAETLSERFGSAIDFENLAVGGKATPWGIEQCVNIAEDPPDLLIIAFGMNDASGKLAPEAYRNNIARHIQIVRDTQPETEFILVATMEANPEWSYASPELYPRYRDELLSLEGPGVAVADVTAVWNTIVRRKGFLNLTGNGLNHPNDFGHRLYAMVILSIFRV